MPIAHAIALDEIDADALPRDRTGLDPEPLEELKTALRRGPLRTPIEVFPLDAPEGHHRWGLIAGLRRLTAFRALRDEGRAGFDEIPAFVRTLDPAAAFAAMVEENEIRAPLSPWERGRAAVLAVGAGFHDTVEAAIDALHPGATRQKRHRLRAVAGVVIEMQGRWTSPERLSLRDLLDLADALRAGFGPPMLEALDNAIGSPHAFQWELIQPYLDECKHERAHPPNPPHAPGRPRRLVRATPKLTVRREWTRTGYVLRFSGADATSALLDEVLDRFKWVYGGK